MRNSVGRSAVCQSGWIFGPAMSISPPRELWCMVGSSIARAMMNGIAFASAAPQRRPRSAHTGQRLAAAPSKIDGRTSIQRTLTYARTQTATSSRADEMFQYGTHGSQYAFQYRPRATTIELAPRV